MRYKDKVVIIIGLLLSCAVYTLLDSFNEYDSENTTTKNLNNSVKSTNAKLIAVYTDTTNIFPTHSATTVLVLTNCKNVYNSLSIIWNVIPYYLNQKVNQENICDCVKKIAQQKGLAKKGDLIVFHFDNKTENIIC